MGNMVSILGILNYGNYGVYFLVWGMQDLYHQPYRAF